MFNINKKIVVVICLTLINVLSIIYFITDFPAFGLYCINWIGYLLLVISLIIFHLQIKKNVDINRNIYKINASLFIINIILPVIYLIFIFYNIFNLIRTSGE